MSEIEIRELKTKDAFRLAKILLSLSDEAVEEVSNLATQKEIDEEANKEEIEKKETQLGLQMAINIFQIVLENAEDELLEWFADLTDMSKGEFEETRMDTPLIVVDEITQQEGFENFLQRASSLYKRMNTSAEQLNKS